MRRGDGREYRHRTKREAEQGAEGIANEEGSEGFTGTPTGSTLGSVGTDGLDIDLFMGTLGIDSKREIPISGLTPLTHIFRKETKSETIEILKIFPGGDKFIVQLIKNQMVLGVGIKHCKSLCISLHYMRQCCCIQNNYTITVEPSGLQ